MVARFRWMACDRFWRIRARPREPKRDLRHAVPLLKHGGAEIDSIESKDTIIQSKKGRNKQ